MAIVCQHLLNPPEHRDAQLPEVLQDMSFTHIIFIAWIILGTEVTARSLFSLYYIRDSSF
jgi:hypothetical protein